MNPNELRSARWFAPDDFRSFGHRSRLMQMGYGPADWDGKPVIAIINTWSDVNQCHTHFKQRVEDVRRGVLQAGGFPLELPALSLSETAVKPTTMLYRNLLAMETEELLRSHPVDGAVLMGGCDKTTPGLLMGAHSVPDLPSIYLPAGPMLRGNWKGTILGIWHGRLQVLGRTPRRPPDRGRHGGDRSRHRAQQRHLYDNGHCSNDDEHRRGDRHDPPRRLFDPGTRRQPPTDERRERAPDRRRWCGRA